MKPNMIEFLKRDRERNRIWRLFPFLSAIHSYMLPAETTNPNHEQNAYLHFLLMLKSMLILFNIRYFRSRGLHIARWL